jgi:hypothetical protein
VLRRKGGAMSKLWRTLRTLWHDYNSFGREARRARARAALCCSCACTHAALALRVLLRSLADCCGRAQELETLRRQNAALAEQIRAVRAHTHACALPPSVVAHSLHWRCAAQARARNEALDKLTEQKTLEGTHHTRSTRSTHNVLSLAFPPLSQPF